MEKAEGRELELPRFGARGRLHGAGRRHGGFRLRVPGTAGLLRLGRHRGRAGPQESQSAAPMPRWATPTSRASLPKQACDRERADVETPGQTEPPDARGRVHSITPASAGWTYVGFDVYRLKAGPDPCGGETGDREACIVMLSRQGACCGRGQGFRRHRRARVAFRAAIRGRSTCRRIPTGR